MSQKLKLGSLAILLTVVSTACASHSVHFKTGLKPGKTHTESKAFYLWGVAGDGEVDLSQLCPAGIAEVSSEHAPMDRVLSTVTGGIYTPVTVTVVCADGQAFLASPEPALERIAVIRLDDDKVAL